MEQEVFIHDILKEQFDYVDSLPLDIKKSVFLYTDYMYISINKKLRKDTEEPLDEKEESILKDINYAFANVPKTTKPFTVYRGIVPTKKTGGKFEMSENVSLISASYDKKIAKSFIFQKTCCLLIITIPVGSSILPIEKISERPEEKEILLNRNGYYVLTLESKGESKDESKDEDKITYHITYIPEGSVKL
jgi:hypothetical protein